MDHVNHSYLVFTFRIYILDIIEDSIMYMACREPGHAVKHAMVSEILVELKNSRIHLFNASYQEVNYCEFYSSTSTVH